MEPLERSLVRIFYKNTNNVVGAGFLITKKHVLTCAHVVTSALELERSNNAPQESVRLNFPFMGQVATFDARVVLWSFSLESGDDFAVLELGQMPQEAMPARLIDGEQSQIFSAYGFPEPYPNGVRTNGYVLGKLANGRSQIEAQRRTGYFIEQGFSGTALWNDEVGGVIGMVVSADTEQSMRTAFMFSTQRLKDFIGSSLSDFQLVYHPPIPKKERLYTNLLPVIQFAPKLYLAAATVKSGGEVADKLKEGGFYGSEWLLKNGNILSFHNLDESLWRSICDQGSTETFDTEEWAYTTDENRQREFVYLLNNCLRAKVRDDLRYFKDKDYYYFKPHLDLKPRTYNYRTEKVKTSRSVVTPYGERSDGKPFYYRHSAFMGHFKRYDENWYLEITPTYHFTEDGDRMYWDYETLIKGIKQIERNNAVMGQVRMWGYYLGAESEFDAFKVKYPFVNFGQLVTLDADFGINDDEWVQKDSSAKTSSSGDEGLLI